MNVFMRAYSRCISVCEFVFPRLCVGMLSRAFDSVCVIENHCYPRWTSIHRESRSIVLSLKGDCAEEGERYMEGQIGEWGVARESKGVVGVRGIASSTWPSHPRKKERRGRKRRKVAGNCVGRKGWGLWQEGGKCKQGGEDRDRCLKTGSN